MIFDDIASVTFIIREATPNDYKFASLIYCRAWRHLIHRVLNLEDERWAPETAVIAPTYVATVANEIVGFVEIENTYLHRLYIDPPFHRRGIGAALFALAEQQGATYLWVDEGNEHARRLYANRGWRWTGEFEVGPNYAETRVLRYHRSKLC